MNTNQREEDFAILSIGELSDLLLLKTSELLIADEQQTDGIRYRRLLREVDEIRTILQVKKKVQLN